MMKVLLMVVTASLFVVASAGAREKADAGATVDCRLLQRTVQTSVEADTSSRRGRFRSIREVGRILRENAQSGRGSADCYSCIFQQFVWGVPVEEQRPCGSHDVCVPGDPLDPSTDSCAAAVCERFSQCCKRRWDERCVEAVATVCERPCDVCLHDGCAAGPALHADCDPCVRQVCAADPYCCDTAWDPQCADALIQTCGDTCAVIDPTSIPDTTSTTTTTVPECFSDPDCADGDACTSDSCEGGVCVSVALDCDDADPCTVDECDVGAGCRHTQRSCNDGNGCTDDTCSAPGSAAWLDALDAGALASTDGCIHTAVASCVPCNVDSDCADGNPCTSEVCVAGACLNGTVAGACDDGNPCTVGDFCSFGTCVGGPMKDCRDDNLCTLDYCDSTGACVHDARTCDVGMRYVE